jgi:hypothetical protein
MSIHNRKIERDDILDSMEQSKVERVKKFWYNNPQMKTFKMNNLEGEKIICECGNFRFKLYCKLGGQKILGQRKKLLRIAPIIYNYVCSCGKVLVLHDGQFNLEKSKFGCGAKACPFGKKSMDKDCLGCEYIYEKD